MKKAGLISSGLFLSQIALVSAETNFESWTRSAAYSISDFLNTIQLNPTNFSSLLLGVLLFMIIYTIVKGLNFAEGRWNWTFSAIVSLIITILSFFWLPPTFIDAISLQYGAMGAAILTAIPFIIMVIFTFRATSNLAVARAIWAFYIFYYLTIFLYVWGTGTAPFWSFENLPYMGAIIAGLFIFLFIKDFRNFVFKGELDARKEKGLHRVKVRKALDELKDEEAKGYLK